jgi:hypothetical protein
MCSVHIVKISAKVRKGRQKHNNSDDEKKIMKGVRRQESGVRPVIIKPSDHQTVTPPYRNTAIP